MSLRGAGQCWLVIVLCCAAVSAGAQQTRGEGVGSLLEFAEGEAVISGDEGRVPRARSGSLVEELVKRPVGPEPRGQPPLPV